MTVSASDGFTQAVILSVQEVPTGSNLIAPRAIGDVLLTINDATPFLESGGQCEINGVLYTYLSKTDDPVSTLTLAAPGLTEAFTLLESLPTVLVYPYSMEKQAMVQIQGNDDADWARVGQDLVAQIPEGIRAENARETVNLALENNSWVIKDVIGVEPSINGGYITPGSLPSTGGPDGSLPDPVTGLVAMGGIRSVALSWAAIDNGDDLVKYKVYGSKTSGFTPDPTNAAEPTYLGQAGGNMFFAQQAYNSAVPALETLDPTKGPYYFRVAAVDSDGPGPLSAEISSTPLQVNTPDIAINAITAANILANSITADKFSSVLVMALKILLGDRITLSDTEGIEIRSDAGIIRFPSNGDPASIAADLIAFSLTVMDSLNIRGANNYIAGQLVAASGVPDPTSPATLSNYWPSHNDSGLANFRRARGLACGQSADQMYALVVTFVPGATNYEIWSSTNGGAEAKVTTLNPADWGAGYDTGITNVPFFEDNNGGYYLMVFADTATDGVYTYKMIHYDATFHKTGEFPITSPGITNAQTPVAGLDTNAPFASPNYGVVVGWRQAADNKLHLQRYTSAGALQGAVMISPTTLGAEVQYVNGSASGLGTGYMAVVNNRLYGYTAAGVRDTTKDFASPARTPNTWPIYGVSNTLYESYVEMDGAGTLWHYSWHFQTGVISGKYAWYDNDPLGTFGAGTESKPSPAKSFTRAGGAFLRVDVPAPPDGGDPDDPNTVRLYLTNYGASVYQSQGVYAPGSLSASFNNIAAGTAPLTVSGFASRTNAVGHLKSAIADAVSSVWDLAGDGSGRVGPYSWDINGKAFGHVRASVAQRLAGNDINIPNNAETAVRWTSVVADPSGQVTIDTALNGTGRMTFVRGGRYAIEWAFSFASNATGQRYFRILNSAAGVISHDTAQGTAGQGSQTKGTLTQDFAAGDYVTFVAFQNSGVALGVFGASYGFGHISATRVG